ncbi:NADH-quinone oxidoreductase subunit H [Kibdelosporangium philippinense]|uniref:NADH-quinone oxidoreductase subunit H n=2 Tax=Kibdelosporangium philippinense TaxID=211113 RepID=A0ABS8ZUU3_9PSEU|nr:NADH-quinone oxidoreductase subunit H [Kibdelosporangium philippinense]MCE7010750.1 NADH-quinone oxidoreductase subunit H [Kibdelosporangium philippinense]
MVEAGPWWIGLLLPAILGAFALGAAMLDAGSYPLKAAAGLLIQQRRKTLAADILLLRAGIFALVAAAVLAAVVIPLGEVAVLDTGVGVVWFNMAEVLAWAAVWMVGWGANSAYAMVGGYRFVAQGLAYELPHMFALITAALGAESLRVGDIVEAQRDLWFVVWMPAAFVVYLLSVLGMAFWGPFDQPAGRDIGGGARLELSGVDRLLFEGGRWMLLTAGAAFAVPLFLGGGGWGWVIVKTAAALAALVWLKKRVPTVRLNRYVEFAWIVLIPVMLVQALVVAVVVLVR